MLALALTIRQRRRNQRAVPSEQNRGVQYNFRGGNALFQEATDAELLLRGGAETGKTIAALSKLNRIAWEYPRAQLLIVRKKHVDLQPTVLQTFEQKILGASRIGGELIGTPVTVFGGERASWYQYPTGSRIWVGGLDDYAKVLSAERDIIYVNQAEELVSEDWLALLTRTTGRSGVVEHPQLVGDANPAGESHWILKRAREGHLRLLHTTLKDNPNLYNDDGSLTEQGQRTFARLSSLTGHLRKRLFEGLDASPEGLVYEEFTTDNITQDAPNPDLPFELAADDGYVDPRAILFIQRTGTEILVFDEIYHSRHLAETCVKEVIERSGNWFGWRYFDADGNELDSEPEEYVERKPKVMPSLCVGSVEAKELQGQFRRANIPYRGGTHRPLTAGIDVVRRLFKDDKGVRSLKINGAKCPNTINEITEGYLYPAGSNRAEQPNDENNHGCDALRYWCWVRARR